MDLVSNFPAKVILRGERLACAWPPHRLAHFEALIEGHVGIGRHRTLKQDGEFGIAQIVEIAIRGYPRRSTTRSRAWRASIGWRMRCSSRRMCP